MKLKITKSKTEKLSEPDGLYILKLVILIILGSIWLRIKINSSGWAIPLPLGFAIGLILTSQDRFQIDRKIEYALLLAAMFISFFLPIGLVLAL